jgi:hypothetical protein
MLGQPYVECQGVTVPRRQQARDPQAGQGPRRLQWWAHFAFTRINTTPTFLCKEIEDVREVRTEIQSPLSGPDRLFT